jgi:hypothetical protein
MAVKRRGGAFALVVAALVGAGASACSVRSGVPPGPPRQQDLDAAVYQECSSVCVRPSDCAQAYNDDGICPPGFLCALRFNCNPD